MSYAVAPGTTNPATAGSDYGTATDSDGGTPGTLTIAAGQTTGEDLRQGRQIGTDPVGLLGAAGRDAEAVHHLVKDQQRAVLGGKPAQRL